MFNLFHYAFKFARELGGGNIFKEFSLFVKDIFCVCYWRFFGIKEFKFSLIFKNRKFFVYLDQTIDLNVLGEIFIDKEYSFPYGDNIRQVIDLGSNIGISCIFFHIIFPNAEILAVEPNIKLKDKFIKNTSWINGLKLFSLAINDKRGEFNLNLGKNHLASSLFSIKNSPSTMTTKTESLKSFFKENNLDQVDIIKFDIEGGEKFILENSFYQSHSRYIVGEIHEELAKINISPDDKMGWSFLNRNDLGQRVIIFGQKN